MICKKCSTENPEEAVFCFKCGSRLDGKIACPACGTALPADANFCFSCGKRLKSVQHCRACGREFEGSFCPKCGTPATTANPYAQPVPAYTRPAPVATNPTYAQPTPVAATPAYAQPTPVAATPAYAQSTPVAATPAYVQPAPAKVRPGLPTRSILDIVGGALGMVAVLFSFIFVFLIGATLTLSTDTQAVSQTTDIYYYFSGAYDDLDQTLASLLGYTAEFEMYMYVPNIIATVIVVASLALVVVFSLLAIVSFSRAIVRKKYDKGNPFAIAAALSYLGGTAAYLGLHAAHGYTSFTTAVAPSPATIAGLVLVCAFLLGSLACKAVANVKPAQEAKRIPLFTLSAVGAVVIPVLLAFVALPFVEITTENGTASMSLILLITTICSLAQSLSDPTGIQLVDGYSTSSACALVGAIATIAAIALLLCVAGRCMRNVMEGEERGCLSYGIILAVLGTAVLVCAVFAAEEFLRMQVDYTEYKIYVPAFVLVAALLVLGLTIAHKVLWTRAAKRPMLLAPQECAAPVEAVPAAEEAVPTEEAAPLPYEESSENEE